jgi:prepilin-type N-terminal cleavage/methylation domain-containing protein
METSLSTKRASSSGFTLLETLIAITILAVGLSSLAALVAQCYSGTERARYQALATTLTSEKLEDLNRWPNGAPNVVSGGSLTSDASVGGINYYDDIDLSNTTGQVSETVSISGGYSSIIHKATGEVISNQNSAAPTNGATAFHRRWLIEPDPTVNGITLTGSRRVTVLVTCTNLTIKPTVTYQMSLIRP